MSGIHAWWARRTTRWGLWIATAVFMLPALSGLIGRITKGKEFGIDFNALACAAGNVAGGVSMYAPAQFCEGFGTPGYV